VVDFDNFWWEDTSCLAQDTHEKTIGIICQYDISTATSPTTSLPETTLTTRTSTAGATTAETTTEETTSVRTTSQGTTTASGCPGGWQEFQGHCYQWNTYSLSWVDAEDDCERKGSHLASVHSKAENDFMWSLCSNNYYWIGGIDEVIQIYQVVIKLIIFPQKLIIFCTCI